MDDSSDRELRFRVVVVLFLLLFVLAYYVLLLVNEWGWFSAILYTVLVAGAPLAATVHGLQIDGIGEKNKRFFAIVFCVIFVVLLAINQALLWLEWHWLAALILGWVVAFVIYSTLAGAIGGDDDDDDRGDKEKPTRPDPGGTKIDVPVDPQLEDLLKNRGGTKSVLGGDPERN